MKKLGFSFMQLPQNGQDGCRSVDVETVKKMVDQFMGNDFTYFDVETCHDGGEHEEILREVLVKRYPRYSYTITDKLPLCRIHDEKEISAFFESQLSRLGVEYVDYYWLDAVGEASVHRAEDICAYEFLKQKKTAGKIHICKTLS